MNQPTTDLIPDRTSYNDAKLITPQTVIPVLRIIFLPPFRNSIRLKNFRLLENSKPIQNNIKQSKKKGR